MTIARAGRERVLPPRVGVNVWRLLLAAAAVWLAYISGRQLATGYDFRLFLLWMAGFAFFVLRNPRLGLYAFCFTLVLIPFEWRLAGSKLASPNAIVVLAAGIGWAASMVSARQRVYRIKLLVPLLVAVAVTMISLIRYGPGYFRVPLILGESVLLFVLGAHLIRSGRHLREFLSVFALAFIVRNIFDLIITIGSILQGEARGAIRLEELWLPVAATSEAEWRVLLLPLFLAMTVVMGRSRTRTLGMVALLLDVAWLSLSGTRAGFLGMGIAAVFLFLILPSHSRRRMAAIVVVAGIVGAFLAAGFSGSWSHILEKNQADIVGGFSQGRLSLWRDALLAFLAQPLFGSGAGPAHSYFLSAGRHMGLVFLVPFGLALWWAWREGAWLRRQPLDDTSAALVLGVQAGLLVAVVLNFISTTFQTAVAAMFFWMLMGVQEALYLDVRSGRHAIVRPGGPANAAGSTPGWTARRGGVVSPGSSP